MSVTSEDTIARIFGKLDDIEEKIGTQIGTVNSSINIEALSVRQTIALAAFYHESGWKASEIFNAIAQRHDPDFNDIDVTQVLIKIGENYADVMIENWRKKLFAAKLAGGKKLSDWRETLAHVLADPDARMSKTHVSIVSSLPKYNEYEERYSSLASKYGTRAEYKKIDKPVTTRLTYIECWSEHTRKGGRQIVYAFKTDNDNLVIVPFRMAADRLETKMMAALLKYTDKFKITGRAYYRTVGTNQYALQYSFVTDIEALDENV